MSGEVKTNDEMAEWLRGYELDANKAWRVWTKLSDLVGCSSFSGNAELRKVKELLDKAS